MTLVGSWMFCCNRACWLLLMAPQPSPKVLLWVAEASQLNPFQSHPCMPALWNKTTWIYLGHQWQCCYITNILSGNLRICYGSHDPFVFIFSAFNMLIHNIYTYIIIYIQFRGYLAIHYIYTDHICICIHIPYTYWLLLYNHILIDSWFNLNCKIPELPETIFSSHIRCHHLPPFPARWLRPAQRANSAAVWMTLARGKVEQQLSSIAIEHGHL